MPSLVTVFVALIAAISSSNKVESSPAQALDLNKILELVQQHRINTAPSKPRKLQLRIVSSDSDSDDSSTDSDESDDSDNKRLSRITNDRIVDLLEKGAKDKINNDRLSYSKAKKTYRQVTDKADDSEIPLLAKERVIDLIETVAKDKTNSDRLTYRKGKKSYGQRADTLNDPYKKRLARKRIIDIMKTIANVENNQNDRIKIRQEKSNYDQENYLVHNKKYEKPQNVTNNALKQVLDQLFSRPSNDEVIQKKPKKKLIPNRLTPTVTMDDVKKFYEKQYKNNEVTNEVTKNDEVTGLENYSKIYIVLNPQAVQNSKNKNSLNELISKVLSLSSATSNRVPEVKEKPHRYKGFVINDAAPVRRFKMISDKLSDGVKKLDPLLVPDGITAVPN